MMRNILDFLQHEVDLCREQNESWVPYSKVKPSDFITEVLEYR